MALSVSTSQMAVPASKRSPCKYKEEEGQEQEQGLVRGVNMTVDKTERQGYVETKEGPG